MEVGCAMALLSVGMIVVMQLGYVSLRERTRRDAEQLAIESAANVFEAARAVPWESLTPEWAGQQQLPDEIDQLVPGATLVVVVEPVENQRLVKRLAVEVRWPAEDGTTARPVRLETLLSARSTAAKAGTP